MSDVTDYIKTQWDDIHHSRNQDWRILQLIGGVFIALIIKAGIPKDFRIAIVVVGLIISLIGFYVSIAHFIIFRSKMGKIARCEKKLCFAKGETPFDFSFKYGRFAVQQMIMIVYVLIISILLAWLIILITDSKSLAELLKSPELAFIPVLVFIIGAFLCLFDKASILTKLFQKPDKNSFPGHPFFAKKEDLENCLNEMDTRPLKLIVPKRYKDESEWKEECWSYEVKNSKVVNKVLVNKKDSFQFSVANSQSKQDYHVHKGTIEIYVSDFDIELFLEKNKEPHLKSNGVLIVPPNIPHEVKLSGLTYVFQISKKKFRISEDK